MKFFLKVFLIFSCIFSVGEIKSQDTTGNTFKKKIKKFFSPIEGQQNTLLTVSVGYTYIPKGDSWSEAGTGQSIGLNLARFFSRKFVFGIVADVKGGKGLTTPDISSNWINSFNQNANSSHGSNTDSVYFGILSSSVNSKKLAGNYFSKIGIMFSPFPNKYGGFLVKISKGMIQYPISQHNPKYFGDADFVYITLHNTTQVEISFKPMAFFHNTSPSDKKYGINFGESFNILNHVILSFVYEKISWKDAEFEGKSFSTFLKPAFFDKYGTQNRFGFRVSFGIY